MLYRPIGLKRDNFHRWLNWTIHHTHKTALLRLYSYHPVQRSLMAFKKFHKKSRSCLHELFASDTQKRPKTDSHTPSALWLMHSFLVTTPNRDLYSFLCSAVDPTSLFSAFRRISTINPISTTTQKIRASPSENHLDSRSFGKLCTAKEPMRFRSLSGNWFEVRLLVVLLVGKKDALLLANRVAGEAGGETVSGVISSSRLLPFASTSAEVEVEDWEEDFLNDKPSADPRLKRCVRFIVWWWFVGYWDWDSNSNANLLPLPMRNGLLICLCCSVGRRVPVAVSCVRDIKARVIV